MMQEKLKKKISKNIFISTLIFILLTSIITAFIISRNYVNSFVNSADQSVKLATSYSQIKLNNIRNDSYQLGQNQTLIDGLKSDKYAISINPKLNFLRSQYQEEISSIILYASNDYIYKTDSISVSSVMPLTSIIDSEQLSDLNNPEENTYFFIQNQDKIITHFSFIHQIYQDNQFLGYLLVNIRPYYILNNYLSYQSSGSVVVINQYLVINDEKYYFNNIETSDQIDNEGFLDHKTYVTQENMYNDTLPLITKISTEKLVTHLLQLLLVITIINTLSLLLSYFVGKILAKRISLRFTLLQEKMLKAPSEIK